MHATYEQIAADFTNIVDAGADLGPGHAGGEWHVVRNDIVSLQVGSTLFDANRLVAAAYDKIPNIGLTHIARHELRLRTDIIKPDLSTKTTFFSRYVLSRLLGIVQVMEIAPDPYASPEESAPLPQAVAAALAVRRFDSIIVPVSGNKTILENVVSEQEFSALRHLLDLQTDIDTTA